MILIKVEIFPCFRQKPVRQKMLGGIVRFLLLPLLAFTGLTLLRASCRGEAGAGLREELLSRRGFGLRLRSFGGAGGGCPHLGPDHLLLAPARLHLRLGTRQRLLQRQEECQPLQLLQGLSTHTERPQLQNTVAS